MLQDTFTLTGSKAFYTSYNSIYCRIFAENLPAVLQLEWVNYADAQEAKAVMEHVLEIIQNHQATCLLNLNQTARGMYPSELVIWLNDYWRPKAYQYGLRKIATVLAQDIFTRLSAQERAATRLPQAPIVFRCFDDLEEATSWLLADSE